MEEEGRRGCPIAKADCHVGFGQPGASQAAGLGKEKEA